ncbi:hypothetical protein SAMN05444422_101386 [Halobiforma haloterrestris]|uniref:DUF6199 domain-containing protein n=1 Tax=Natronobacterium haloterrestre TaxID=148448 RepID=A0A1I1D848_NATHA|nr:hypothetical protein [Halobiforma haloterrestris]SFB71095.1 hypothetical protein SAMN05444422_101386 [Halobiforma haloterrestris]
MVVSKLMKLCYAGSALYGLLAAATPRRALALSLRAWTPGLENVSELEPREWYVRNTRAVGVGMLAAGLAGLALEQRAAETEETAEGTDDGPVTVEVGDGSSD